MDNNGNIVYDQSGNPIYEDYSDIPCSGCRDLNRVATAMRFSDGDVVLLQDTSCRMSGIINTSNRITEIVQRTQLGFKRPSVPRNYHQSLYCTATSIKVALLLEFSDKYETFFFPLSPLHPPSMTEATQQEDKKQYWEDKKLADQTVENIEFDKKANSSQASYPPRKLISPPMPPGFSFEQRKANIRQYRKDKELADETAKNTKFNKIIPSSASANYNQASLPGIMEEAQQVGNRQYGEGKTLADQTAKNTQFDKKIKWADLPYPIQPQEVVVIGGQRHQWSYTRVFVKDRSGVLSCAVWSQLLLKSCVERGDTQVENGIVNKWANM
ncbi:hypothetical protein G7Y89_g5507 [Cudoniella acicularis]|uniref:Uncharacterized protein n=1 Tax=Cudoniella acicularis TaxID=354080 RepID=A0A8H4RPM2_9HELO|nr:hypothetical protein G7Y89_g5507 [Cudoniella acicularis]